MHDEDLAERARRFWMIEGPTPTTALAEALAISQPTASRLVRRLAAEVVVSGKARATRVGLRRSIPGVRSPIPVRRIDAHGTAVDVGTLHAVHPAGVVWLDAPNESTTNGVVTRLAGPHPSLPWRLADLRPSGFLGRLLPRQHPHLQLPADLRHWSDDDVLRFLTAAGADLVGDLIVGDDAFRRWQETSRTPVDPTIRTDYPRCAETILSEGLPGSSAGGEQAKFLVDADQSAPARLVKFSPPTTTALGRRVSDLLRLEHHALQALRSVDVDAAETHLVVDKSSARTFLEVVRFDRIGSAGRRGLVSLATLDDAFVGARSQRWSDIVDALHRQRLVSSMDLQTVRLLEAFGVAIDNTDMHRFNLSFFVDEDHRLTLAPAYDMLPMGWAPVAGEVLPPRRLRSALPATADIAERLQAALTAYVVAAQNDDALSDDVAEGVAGLLA